MGSLEASPPSRETLCRDLAKSSNLYFGRAQVPALRVDASPEERHRAARVHLESGEFERAFEALAPLLEDPASAATATHWLAGLIRLRHGEALNCLHHTGDATVGREVCLLPLRKGALHRNPQPAASAAQHFLSVLEARPRDPMAAWLLNLAARLGKVPERVPERYRSSAMNAKEGDVPQFVNRAAQLGVAVQDLAGGAAIEDFDGDGRLDLLTSTWDPCGGLRAFRNLGERFVDVTKAWGLDQTAGGLNLLTVDIDGDRRVDLLVTRGAWLLGDGEIPTSILRNEPGPGGTPRFGDVSNTVGLGQIPAAPTQAAVFADFDLDGDLDLYLGHEATAAHPFSSRLLRNDGVRFGESGENELPGFVDVTAAAGVANLRFAKAVHTGDIDNDGDPDLYVSNFGLNRMYLNQFKETGELRFVDRARELGVTEPAVESFGSWFFDVDNDGDLDLFVSDYGRKAEQIAASYFEDESWIGRTAQGTGRPLLYRNLLVEWGHLGFEEVADQLGLRRPAMPMGVNFADLDNNGELDIYLGTGEPDLASQFPNQTYLQHRGTFDEATLKLGLGHLQKGHGVAFGDLDRDGDVDLLHQLGGFYRGDPGANALFENRIDTRVPATERRWVTLHFETGKPNRYAVGARVRIVASRGEGEERSTRSIERVVGTGAGFGASSLQLEVGLGDATVIERIEVRWPTGEWQTFRDVPLEFSLRLHQGKNIVELLPQETLPIFEVER